VTQLLDEIKDEPLTPNNKSTVITCLMTAYMLKHLGMKQEYDQFIATLRCNEEYRYQLTRIIKIAMQYFSERPCDSIDLQPIIYVEYNPVLI
jgi:hypothetical protein